MTTLLLFSLLSLFSFASTFLTSLIKLIWLEFSTGRRQAEGMTGEGLRAVVSCSFQYEKSYEKWPENGGSEKLRKLSHSSDSKWHFLDLSIPIVLILKSHTRGTGFKRGFQSWESCYFLMVLTPSWVHSVSSVQSLSCVQLFATPWTAARQASLSITNSRSLLKLMSIESVMPSNHLILCHLLLLPPSIFASTRVFSNESVLCIRWAKDWSFSLNISPSNEYSRLISFRMDWLDQEGQIERLVV